jgi:hypothetical protein
MVREFCVTLQIRATRLERDKIVILNVDKSGRHTWRCPRFKEAAG